MQRRDFLALPLSAAMSSPLSAGSLTQGERDRALSHFHGTRKMFLDIVNPLSEAQWTWKPAAGRWSMEEVAEHIAMSEETLFQLVMGALKKPPADSVPAGQSKKDEIVIKGVPERTTRVQAPEMLRPRKSFPNRAATVAAFLKARDRNIAFVRETGEDLRGRLESHPALGPLDVYQWLIFISAHCERHLAQMREVAGTEGFPKS